MHPKAGQGSTSDLTDQAACVAPVADVSVNGQDTVIANCVISPDYEPSVGDQVEIVKEYYLEHPVGSVLEIDRLDSNGNFWVDGYCYSPIREREYIKIIPKQPPSFTGSYKERQEQAVKHYGWKVGSKVKVVREFTTDEDGCYAGWNKGKSRAIGEICQIVSIALDRIVVNSNVESATLWPYFALESAE